MASVVQVHADCEARAIVTCEEPATHFDSEIGSVSSVLVLLLHVFSSLELAEG
jgi:hypothetical protein